MITEFLELSIKNICCGYSLESPHNNEYPQHIFLWTIYFYGQLSKIIPKLL